MANEIKVYEVSGTAHDTGFQQGEMFKADIERIVEQFYQIYDGFKLSKDQVLRRAMRYVPFIEDYSPEIAEEMKGIAEGSGKDLAEVAMIVAYYEIYDRVAFTSGCTSLGVSPQYTKDNEAYVAQNWDDDVNWYWDGDMPRLLKKRRKTGPDVLAYTYPGMPAGAGMNSYGIGLCWNTMHCEKSKVGVPTYVILTEVLHQKRIDDALGAILRVERAESFNYVMGSKEGEIYNVEANPEIYDIQYVETCMGHANHFVSKKIPVKKDIIVDMIPDTIVRHNRMNKLLNMKAGEIELKECMTILSDHVNYPNSICRHYIPGEKFEMKTFDSIVLALSKGEMWLAHGNPCETEYKKYTL